MLLERNLLLRLIIIKTVVCLDYCNHPFEENYTEPKLIVRKGPFPKWWPDIFTPHRRIDCFGHKSYCRSTTDCCLGLVCSRYRWIAKTTSFDECTYPVENIIGFATKWAIFLFTRNLGRSLIDRMLKKSGDNYNEEKRKRK